MVMRDAGPPCGVVDQVYHLLRVALQIKELLEAGTGMVDVFVVN